MLLILAFNLFGDALRDYLYPEASVGGSDTTRPRVENTRATVNPGLVDALVTTWLHSRQI